MNRRFLPLIAAAALPIALPVAAQTPAPAATASAGVTTGATVYDTSGAVVGTIDSVDATNAVLNTGTVKATIALTSFGKGAKGPVLGLTRAQLEQQVNAQAAQANAAFREKLVAGADVYGAGGVKLGTIASVTGDTVTITTTDGDAALPIAGFGPGPNGVTIGLTAAQLSSAMSAATPAAASPTPATPN